MEEMNDARNPGSGEEPANTEASKPTATTEGERPNAIDVMLADVKAGKLDVKDAREMLNKTIVAGAGAMLSLAQGPSIPNPVAGESAKWTRATIPEGMRMPVGLQIVYMRFPSSWTRYRAAGIQLPGEDPAKLWRTAVCWELTDGEETQAYKRAMGDAGKASGELSKQMLRAIDGKEVDWSASRTEPSSPDGWWTGIGAKCRGLVTRAYTQLHNLGPAEMVTFFESCVESRFGA